MNKRILVISNKNSLIWGLYNEICSNESIELIAEPSGSNTHNSIKEKRPDLVIVDLETPELGKSRVSIQLAGIDIKDQIPKVALLQKEKAASSLSSILAKKTPRGLSNC